MGMNIGGLFSGIGGLELGLESAGLGRVEWMAEADPFRRSVLARHWPSARIFEDVREVDDAATPVDLICGGFPCQDLSSASHGRGQGLEGPKSGLWSEFRRIISALRPTWVVIENAPTWRRWVPVVRRELWADGYASLPIRVSARDAGATHQRDRVFLVAHADRDCESIGAVHAEVAGARAASTIGRDWRTPPPGGFRVADGVPGELDEVEAYGNAVVPAVAELLGRCVVRAIAG